MRFSARSAFALALAFVVLSCREAPVAPRSLQPIAIGDSTQFGITPPQLVISQVYGGGGNAGAVYKNDFIEIFNPGNASVDVSGWSVQYASSTGNSWQVTAISGIIPPGSYYLIQEAAGAGGTTSLPAPNSSGGIPMAAGAGKVALVKQSAAIANGITCPTGANVVDFVAFGSASGLAACNPQTATLTNTTAALRLDVGCRYTANVSADFNAAAPTPRNLASAPHVCGAGVGISPSPVTLSSVGATQQFTAAENDLTGGTVTTTFTWTSSNTGVATVSNTGLATAIGDGSATITATAADGFAGTASLTVSIPAVVTVTPDAASAFVGGTRTFVAAAKNTLGNLSPTTFTWSSDNTAVATVSAAGVANALGVGSAKITAKASNGVEGSATFTVSVPPPPPDVVISQIYGGGGNSGATLLNDFVEIYNHGDVPVDLTGWTVSYGSANASTWGSPTTLSGTIQPGRYLLVVEAPGSNTNATPVVGDLNGSLALSGTDGKIVLAMPGASITGACPNGPGIVDRVSYGTTNCATDWNGAGPRLGNTSAAFRVNDGCQNTHNVTVDFVELTPNPRNSASPAKSCTQPVRTQSSATIVVNEIMGDPANAESASWGEWFEVHNYGSSAINLRDWTIVSGGTSQPDHRIAADVIVPAGGFAVLGRGGDVARNGGVQLDYNYFVHQNSTIWLDDADFLMLVDNAGARVDSVAWTAMAHGVTRALRDPASSHAAVDGSAWGYSTIIFGDGDYGTPETANGTLSNTAVVISGNKFIFTGRLPTDPALPVGFEDQLFANETDANGVPVTGTTVSWSSLTPSIATINPTTGVMHALAAGTMRFLATSTSGAAKIYALQAAVATSGDAQYLDHTAFGEPTDNDAGDDFIVRRSTYTTSWNGPKGIPNWVAWNLNGTQTASGEDRCDCWTFDPVLKAAGFTPYTTADYTGSGAFHGYGIDRGHMTRSFDRTNGSLDNATTFYFSNAVPQAADVNQGPWANMENYLGALAKNQNKEIYIYVGPAGSKGTLKNQGKVNIPEYTWKIAMIMNRGQGLADVHDYRDVEVLAVVMPNIPGSVMRDSDWHDYIVTADSVEHLTGYHFMSALPANTQRALKTGTQPPLAHLNGPYSGTEASAISMSGAQSLDPNGTIVSYDWSFGDGTTATGASVSHTYARYGSYNVRLITTDNDHLVDTVLTTAIVSNVAPQIAAVTNATIVTGGTYATTGSFSDVGAGPFTATVDYGDGSGAQTLALNGTSFTLSHTYASHGAFPVTVSVSDGRDAATSFATVTVLAPPVARANGPYASSEGSTVALSSASTDADGSIVSYDWDFGDGSPHAATAVASHVYAQDGTYSVTLTVTDNDGLSSTTATTSVVGNVAPSISAFAGATLLPGETFNAASSFTDPGADAWTATVSYGEGPTSALLLSGKSFSLAHVYGAAGTFTVSVGISDDHTTTSSSAVVTVLTPAQGTRALLALVQDVQSLSAKLEAAAASLDRGNTTPAANQLEAFSNEVSAMVRSGRMTAERGSALQAEANRVIRSIRVSVALR